MAKVNKTDEQWRKEFGAERYAVAREKGTERAFTGEYWSTKTKGRYLCACCNEELFSSDHKYDSGSGWPSFWTPARADRVRTETDTTHGMRRTEVLCSNCDAHLGHVFEDGPRPTGLRYCINSISLVLDPDGDESERGAK